MTKQSSQRQNRRGHSHADTGTHKKHVRRCARAISQPLALAAAQSPKMPRPLAAIEESWRRPTAAAPSEQLSQATAGKATRNCWARAECGHCHRHPLEMWRQLLTYPGAVRHALLRRPTCPSRILQTRRVAASVPASGTSPLQILGKASTSHWTRYLVTPRSSTYSIRTRSEQEKKRIMCKPSQTLRSTKSAHGSMLQTRRGTLAPGTAERTCSASKPIILYIK